MATIPEDDIDRLDRRLDRMEKLDREMYGTLQGIEQHLSDLNGQVAKNAERSKENRDWVKYGLGGVAVFSALMTLGVAYVSAL